MNTVIVKLNDLMVCVDCLLWFANGDTSGASSDYVPPEIDATPGDAERMNEFSSAPCDACDSPLAGSRHHCVLLGPIDIGEISGPESREFSDAYIEAALWSSTVQNNAGEDLSADNFELTDSVRATLRDQAIVWLGEWHALVASAARVYGFKMAGHDFWLTRNGHGAGFWDGDLPRDLGDALTHAAKACGECDLYLSDDETIEVF